MDGAEFLQYTFECVLMLHRLKQCDTAVVSLSFFAEVFNVNCCYFLYRSFVQLFTSFMTAEHGFKVIAELASKSIML